MSYCSLFKVVLVGNRNVGKTCMVTKYCEGQFIDDQAPTYTANFVIKNLIYQNKNYKLCIWDTSGNHTMVSYLEACCSEANAVILVFDVNDRKSFDDLEFWMPEVQKVCDDQAVKIIVGCKVLLKFLLFIYRLIYKTKKTLIILNKMQFYMQKKMIVH